MVNTLKDINLGLHFAKALFAHGGFSIVLACRNEEKARLAVKEVQKCEISDERKSEYRDIQYMEVFDFFFKFYFKICYS